MLQRILDRHLADDDIAMSRRRFFKQVAGGTLLTLGTPAIAQAAKGRFPAHKTLALEHTHTGEKLKLTYFEKDHYVKGALREINYLLRDFRTGDICSIDVELLDQLHDLQSVLGTKRPFHIISGYRSAATNNKLYEETSGVAQHSLHIEGRAIDIRLEGISSNRIRHAALAMQRGGVGYYPESDFVHLDTGKVRFW